ncbi:tetratricopeptide repeat protein [Aurantimonas sp. C2-3-R2]
MHEPAEPKTWRANAIDRFCLVVFLASLSGAYLPFSELRAQDIETSQPLRAERDINARDIIVNRGYTEDQLTAAVRGSSEYSARIARDLGITESAVTNFFRILGREKVAPDRLLEKLAEIAERHVEQIARLRALDPDDPATRTLLEDATRAIEEGRLTDADLILERAEETELAAARAARSLARQADRAAEKRLLTAAEARAERGGIASQQLDFLRAAEHFEEAADIAKEASPEQATSYALEQAGALYRHGLEKGHNQSLRRAVTIYRGALQERTRDRVPLNWAMTQNNLGNALQTLGERETGTERLEQAVDAYNAALEEYSRNRVPLNWAMTQNNLGNALQTLGEREAGTERLEQAVDAYNAALEEYSRNRVPLDWAAAQNNLGNALQTLGERETGTERLEQAVDAYNAALEEHTRDRVPLDWAMVQNNLGNALQTLGEREAGTERLEQAVDAYNAALEEHTRDQAPYQWAQTQENLAIAFVSLFRKANEHSRLRSALDAVDGALEVYREAQSAYDLGTAGRLRAEIVEAMGGTDD